MTTTIKPGAGYTGPIARIKTGTYTGNGIDNRNVDIGVDLASKDNVWVIVKSAPWNFYGVHRTEHGQGDWSEFFTGVESRVNMIQGFTATGFQVGTAWESNGNGYIYAYIAIWEEQI